MNRLGWLVAILAVLAVGALVISLVVINGDDDNIASEDAAAEEESSATTAPAAGNNTSESSDQSGDDSGNGPSGVSGAPDSPLGNLSIPEAATNEQLFTVLCEQAPQEIETGDPIGMGDWLKQNIEGLCAGLGVENIGELHSAYLELQSSAEASEIHNVARVFNGLALDYAPELIPASCEFLEGVSAFLAEPPEYYHC